MTSFINYIYNFARETWLRGFVNSKSKEDIADIPDRFRDFPKVEKEYCIACGSCTASCPSPNAIKLVRDSDNEESQGLTFPIINKSSCIRCGFCAEVCPSEPKTLYCGENHFIQEDFNIIPSKRKYVIDDYLCIKCHKCQDVCEVGAIDLKNNRMVVNQSKCISCGKCLSVCPVKGAMKGVFIANLEEQKEIIQLVVDTLESYIESKQDDLKEIHDDKLFLSEIDFEPLFKDSLNIINDEELVYEVLEKAINRLNIRLVIWDSTLCNKCQLCVGECPTGAISFDNEYDEIVRNKDKCLRCSICYQTCPFSAIKYYSAKFNLDKKDSGEEVIHITVKESQLAKRRA
ncbi:MAG: 4Fe-4S binding protein [archaeon]|nr:4Fe-4S binding protein [archaeon]